MINADKKSMGRPRSGTGAYIRLYLNHDKLAKFDAACNAAGKTRVELLRSTVETKLKL